MVKLSPRGAFREFESSAVFKRGGDAMLLNPTGNEMRRVPHVDNFETLVRRLGAERASAVRDGLNEVVDQLPVDPEKGVRVFSSSFLGSNLQPWGYPLAHLFDVAREMSVAGTSHEDLRNRAALFFGQFVWECLMRRSETWVVYDPNLGSRDPNKEPIGKTYFEQRS